MPPSSIPACSSPEPKRASASNAKRPKASISATSQAVLPLSRDEFGYPAGATAGSAQVATADAYMKLVKEDFDSAMKKRPGLSTVIDSFLSHLTSNERSHAASAALSSDQAQPIRIQRIERTNVKVDPPIFNPSGPFPAGGVLATTSMTNANDCQEPIELVTTGPEFRWLPVSLNNATTHDFTSLEGKSNNSTAKYNRCRTRPQPSRCSTPRRSCGMRASLSTRPTPIDPTSTNWTAASTTCTTGRARSPKPSCTRASFTSTTKEMKTSGSGTSRTSPDALPPSLIGSMCEESWTRYFPLLPSRHEGLRDSLRRVRALNVMWGTLPAYRAQEGDNAGPAWMPLSEAHRVRLFDKVGLFDQKYRVPTNPWLKHQGSGSISQVFNQSYHSVYHTDSYKAPHFREWITDACRYQVPRPNDHKNGCLYPFSQYGGTPVEGDFLHHRVERCDPQSANKKRHKELIYNRFGMTAPLRIGQQFHDTGLLQDMYNFDGYRQYADLTPEQRLKEAPKELFMSNFMAFARTHAIIALASNNYGTTEASPRASCATCTGSTSTRTSARASNPTRTTCRSCSASRRRPSRAAARRTGRSRSTRARSRASTPSSSASAPRRPTAASASARTTSRSTSTTRRCSTRACCAPSAASACTRPTSTRRARAAGDYRREHFRQDLTELQDTYIDFLQTTIMGMLIESGADLHNVPLHLLEPRELQVSPPRRTPTWSATTTSRRAPRTGQGDGLLGGDTRTRQQLAILSLIPPNNRILGTYRMQQATEIVDFDHIKKQIQKETIASNKKRRARRSTSSTRRCSRCASWRSRAASTWASTCRRSEPREASMRNRGAPRRACRPRCAPSSSPLCEPWRRRCGPTSGREAAAPASPRRAPPPRPWPPRAPRPRRSRAAGARAAAPGVPPEPRRRRPRRV